jgi:hypothetical protein
MGSLLLVHTSKRVNEQVTPQSGAPKSHRWPLLGPIYPSLVRTFTRLHPRCRYRRMSPLPPPPCREWEGGKP